MLRFPEDRVNGFVMLTDGNGTLFVPDFTRTYDAGGSVINAAIYCRAFLILANRYQQKENHDKV